MEDMPSRLNFALRCRIWRNTHARLPLAFYRFVIRDRAYDSLLRGDLNGGRSFVQRLLERALFFWPRITEAKGWVDARSEGQWQPENYIRNEPTRLVSAICSFVPPDSSLLELGCNRGTDMTALWQSGFRRFRGVDASGAGLEQFKMTSPKVWNSCQISHDLFQRYLLNMQDELVDYVYSQGATIELVHPSFPIVQEVCRVAKIGVLLDLSPYDHLRRAYEREFARANFDLVWSTKDEDDPMESHIYFFRRR